MFTVWRGDACAGVLVGRAGSLNDVIEHVDLTGVGRYEVYETGIKRRRWGFVTRNPDRTVTLKPDRSVRLTGWPAGFLRCEPPAAGEINGSTAEGVPESCASRFE